METFQGKIVYTQTTKKSQILSELDVITSVSQKRKKMLIKNEIENMAPQENSIAFKKDIDNYCYCTVHNTHKCCKSCGYKSTDSGHV